MKKEEIAEIARVAAAEVLAKKEELLDEEFDARYQDVKLLMANYRKLKAHYAHISPETLAVNAICAMHSKTGLMMSHVDKMLVAYEAMCKEAGDSDEARRWDALYLRYIDSARMSIDEIASELHIDKRTFYRDINKAMDDLAVLLFGIKAIGVTFHTQAILPSIG